MVLIIEPNENHIASFKAAFSQASCQLHFSKHHHQALSEISQLKPRLVIMDAWGAAEEGTNILKQLRQNGSPQGITILATIPKGDKVLWNRVQSWGADGIITKPFDPVNLARRINKLLPGR